MLYTDEGQRNAYAVDLIGSVCGRELHADARLALRDHGVREADDVDAATKHRVSKLRSEAFKGAKVLERERERVKNERDKRYTDR